MNNSICTLFDNILIDIHKFKSLQNVILLFMQTRLQICLLKITLFLASMMKGKTKILVLMVLSQVLQYMFSRKIMKKLLR